MSGEDWHYRGACNDHDPALWHPEGTSRSNRPDWRTPRDICRGCDVIDQCLEWALSPDDPTEGHGMAGGLDPHQRKQLRRKAS